MPSYQFRLAGDPADFIPEPFDRPDLQAARTEAVALLSEHMSDHPEMFTATGCCYVTVTDGTGEELFTIEMRETIPDRQARRGHG